MTSIQILCAGAVKAAILKLVPAFEEQSGITLAFSFGAVGTLRAKILSGDAAQVLILNRPALQQLAAQGKVEADSITDIGTVGVGIVVQKNSVVPDVSTAQALRNLLLNAKSLSYGDPGHGDSSGIHFAKVLEKLGITEAVASKTKLAAAGVNVVEMVGSGAIEVGATQSSVILAAKETTLAGLLPTELQHFTTYAFGLAPGAGASARAFLDYLKLPAANAHFRQAGFRD